MNPNVNPWTMEAANLFCGESPSDANASNHLTLTELKLPGLDMQYVDHRAGGAPVAIEIDTIIARLECTFSLVGVSPQVMGMLGSWQSSKNIFNAFGVIRDQVTGQAAQARAQIDGQLAKVDPTNWRRGDVMHVAYAIRGITHYELNIAGEPIFFWDFQTNTRIVGGVNQNRAINGLLQIPGAEAAEALSGTGTWQDGQ
jgi:P2 family phage contractile tail tube protein